MRTWWKNTWARRPKLSRGWKLVRNLALGAVGGYLLWSFWGYPLPTAEMTFRRLERQHLLSPSELVFSTPEYGQGTDAASKRDRMVEALDGTKLYLEDCWFAGLTEESVVIASVERGLLLAGDGQLRGYARDGGPLLLPLSQSEWEIPRAYWVEVDYSVGAHYTYHNFVPFLLLDVPGETRRVELSLELRQETGTQILPYQADSWGLGGGVWLVGAWREDGQSPSPWLEGSYTLRLYDEKDTLLKQREGAIPRPL
ncbi:hypothetical protein ACTQ4E_01795 [Lawsonibacter sp. LCP25S3_G6]|uniref:hypothetical protein n=1 Tax=unclassified Lawsonibacter TaxID=2617946 RepID=UPI003F974FC6